MDILVIIIIMIIIIISTIINKWGSNISENHFHGCILVQVTYKEIIDWTIYFIAANNSYLMLSYPSSIVFSMISEYNDYRKTSNISRTLVGNNTVHNSDVFGASPVGAAQSTSLFST